MPTLALPNPFRGLVSLFYPPFCAVCARAVGAGRKSLRELRGEGAADSAAVLREVFATFRRGDHGLVHLRELRESRPAFRSGGFRLPKPGRGARSDSQISNTAAKSICATCSAAGWRRRWTIRASPAGALISSCRSRCIRRDNASAVLTRPSCWPRRSRRAQRPAVSATFCNGRVTPPRRRNSTGASGWKISGAPFVYGAAATCKICGCCWLTMSSPRVRP